MASAGPTPSRVPRLVELALVFLRLGATSFGGPAAHIAFIREDVVGRRRWLSDAELLDLVAAANLIPGPNSTELAMHIGRRRAGVPGLLVAGAAFILPAFLIVLALAMVYRAIGSTPDASWIMGGVAPVVLAVVADALRQFATATVRTLRSAAVVMACTIAALLGAHELLVLATAGAAMLGWRLWRRRSLPLLAAAATTAAVPAGTGLGATIWAAGPLAASAAVTTATPVTLAALTLFFLKVGSVLFGSGYVLLAFLRADLVERWGWLSLQQLLDAIAVGQFTPGPLFTTATFIGYLLAGVPGAVVATVAIFAPGFLFVAVTAPFVDSLRHSPVFSALLDGVVLASLGLMTAVAAFIAASTLVTPARIMLAVTALIVLWWRRPNTAWLVAAGAAIGWWLRGLP